MDKKEVKRKIKNVRKLLNQIESYIGEKCPAPATKPYEMLGEVEIVTPRGTPYHFLETKERGGSCFRFARGVYPIGQSKSRDTALRAYVHEHSCGIPALATCEEIKNIMESVEHGHCAIQLDSPLGKQILAILARLNAGPEKGV